MNATKSIIITQFCLAARAIMSDRISKRVFSSIQEHVELGPIHLLAYSF